MSARCPTSRFAQASRALLLAAAFASAARADVAGIAPEASPDAKRIEGLVEQLGSGDYWAREAAANELRSIGPTAIDALLAAAETHGDLEISLAARWLVDGIPIASPDDGPEAAALLSQYGGDSLKDSVAAMQALLRLDDDSGIDPLARIVRLDRSAAASRMAAALLVREWRPDDPYFRAMTGRILRGLGSSNRPMARLEFAFSA